ncbi:hypothetical protein [Amycolatopsis sp. H20-H5]|uniref:hypothetical protein n=1 Tax=Amycolatopsis sp. H20-H5 TaxID=3046309 RepID=UPI002DBC591C|nr:hypothetical protein [Amycolatopsis sp. H20-H5]MEC3974635.1 hypothetical protein [Amycolatopsis sp. H20-H5]
MPIRMTEAWLLLDESSIRQVAGNPRARHPLHLPKLHEIEKLADPKDLLKCALLAASASTGRRREREAQRFNQQRRQLLERLDHDGPIVKLSSWQRLITDIEVAAASILRGSHRVSG